IISSDFGDALKVGYRALDLAEQSGGAGILRACLGNLGNLFLATGELERGAEYFQRALAVLPSDGENNNASLDGLARIRLAQNNLADCALLLDRIEGSIRSDNDRLFYAHRYAELTRAQLLAREGKTAVALERVGRVLELADKAGDDLLRR